MVKLRSNRAATAGIESKADGTQSSWGDDNGGDDNGGDDNSASRTAHATCVISASSAINHGVGFGHRESKQQGDDCIFHFFSSSQTTSREVCDNRATALMTSPPLNMR
jgi:hypothetical protein